MFASAFLIMLMVVCPKLKRLILSQVGNGIPTCVMLSLINGLLSSDPTSNRNLKNTSFQYELSPALRAYTYWFIIPPTNAEMSAQPTEYQPSEIGLRIYPTHVVQYYAHDRGGRARSSLQLRAQLHLKENKPHGQMSYKAAKRIKNSVNWLVASSQQKRVYSKIDGRNYSFRLNFITLTLPSLDHGLTDHQFKHKLLRNWLARMKYKHGLRNYVWKVETQQNGNIHCHLTTDCFIHYSEIRNSWNDLLIKNDLMKSFADKFGHSDPNSTDVKAIKHIKNIGAYLAKYFSKDDADRRKVSGKLWASSFSLSDRHVCNIIVPPDDDSNVVSPLVSCKAQHIYVESEPNVLGLRKRLATVYLMKPSVWKSLAGSVIHSHYLNRIKEIRTGIPVDHLESLNFNSLTHVRFNSTSRDSRALGATRRLPADDTTPAQETYTAYGSKPWVHQLDLFQCIPGIGLRADRTSPPPRVARSIDIN